jgi:hypothetical protein
MHKTFFAAIAALLLPVAAPAQITSRPDPLDATAATAPLLYRSALSGYKPLAAESVAWRDANDAVLRIGGWRAYAREAAAPAASSPAPAAAAPTPEPRSSQPATPPSGHRH